MAHLKSFSRRNLFAPAAVLSLVGMVAIVPWRLAAQEPHLKGAPEVNAKTFRLAPNTFRPNIPEEPDHYVVSTGPTTTLGKRPTSLAAKFSRTSC